VRILTTLALPDAGRAAVAGIDVVKRPGQVRRYIGVADTVEGLNRRISSIHRMYNSGGDAGRPADPGPAPRTHAGRNRGRPAT
jgi:hypothetical protein